MLPWGILLLDVRNACAKKRNVPANCCKKQRVQDHFRAVLSLYVQFLLISPTNCAII